MNERQLGTQAVSIVIDLYLDILRGIPDLLNILDESKASSYYGETVSKEIHFTGNATTIAADDGSARAMEIKLQEKGIPFIKGYAGKLDGKIKSNGCFVFVLREVDYSRTLEAAKEVQQDLEKVYGKADIEEELELTREGEGTDSLKETEEENILEENLENSEDDSRESDGKNEKNLKEKTSKKKRKNSSSHIHDSDRKEIPYYEKPYDHTLMGEGRFHGSPDENNQKTEKQKGGGTGKRGHTAYQDTGAAHNAAKSMDFKNRKIEEGQSTDEMLEKEKWIAFDCSQDTPLEKKDHHFQKQTNTSIPRSKDVCRQSKYYGHRQKGISVYSAKVSKPLGVTDFQFHKVNEKLVSFDKTSVSVGSQKAEWAVTTNANGKHNLQLPHKQGSNQYINTQITDHLSVLGNGTNILTNTVSKLSPRSGTSIERGILSKQSVLFQNVNTQKQQSPHDKLQSNSKTQFLTKGGKNQHHLTIHRGKESSAGCDRFNQRDLPKHEIFVLNRGKLTTKNIHISRTAHHVQNVFSPTKLQTVFMKSKHIMVQSIVSYDTESGKAAHDMVDLASPVARLAKGKFLEQGAVHIASSTHCDIEILSAIYAVKNGITWNEARAELAQLNQWDRMLIKKNGVGIHLNNNESMLEKLMQLQEIKRDPMGFTNMIRWIQKGNKCEFIPFIHMLNISDELKKELLSIPLENLTVLKIDELMRKFGNKALDKNLLDMLYVSKIQMMFSGRGSFHFLFRQYFNNILRRMGRDFEANRAFGQLYMAGRYGYTTYSSGMKLMFTVARKFHITAPQVLEKPLKAIWVSANPKLAIGNSIRNSSKVKAAVSKFGTGRQKILHSRTAKHANHALMLLTGPKRKLQTKLIHTRVGKFVSNLVDKTKILTVGVTKFAAKAMTVFGQVAAAALVLLLLLSFVSNLYEEKKIQENAAPVQYNFAADTEIVQEIIMELTGKNEAFIADINDAANHRGSYASTTGLMANENVGFYEQGAYHIIFRDIYGNELEPTHVDLNNTKGILSMASKFMPYPFQMPSANGSAEEKKAYEDMKQHFKDYCNFLWAATHQISIEEYHPGNSDGMEGAVDLSGLVTTLDKGKCDKDGAVIWLKLDFTKDIVPYNSGKWICNSCSNLPATGLGDYWDDLCTHGKDANPHGGWRLTGSKPRLVYNCQTDHRHYGCDEENHDTYTCEELGNASPKSHAHLEYEWVYECGGHMGSVVYVTIGDLSRMPGFSAAKDVDYELVGKYDTGDSLMGSSVSSIYAEAESKASDSLTTTSDLEGGAEK
ncbi:hypothetical protein D3Z55_23290 [Clostridiaceae bacterium]|nr:hypothetical protein [Clostridiaceae bacterium]